MSRDKYESLPILHFAEQIKKKHAKKSLKCIIFGNFGAMNLGDEAILAGEITELQKIPNLNITVIGKFPKEVHKMHKVPAISMYDLYKVRKEIKKSDFVVIGGGGLINKIERSFNGFLFQLYMIFTFFFLPRSYKKRLYITGIGIYNNANPLIVKLVLPFFRGATLLTVRDAHSHEFLKHKNVHAGLYKDNSFLMEQIAKDDVLKHDFFKKHYQKARMNIGISLVKPDSKKDEKRLMEEVKKFIKEYHEKADFWLYATDANPVYHNDLMIGNKLIEELKKEYGEAITFHIVPTNLSPKVYFSSFKLMDFMIAMRFHAAVFAYRNKIAFAGIPYDKKCTSFITSVGKKPINLKTITHADISKNVS